MPLEDLVAAKQRLVEAQQEPLRQLCEGAWHSEAEGKRLVGQMEGFAAAIAELDTYIAQWTKHKTDEV